MTLARQNLGRLGEDLAVRELEARGYAVIARRYRTRCGEIDIIALDGETTVFVEVKARVSSEFGTAAEAVTRAKQLRLARMAFDYVARHGQPGTRCRFDVVAIDEADCPEPEITIFINAFDAPA